MPGREVDFVVTDRRKPILIVEDCAAWQIHAQGVKDYQTPEGIRVAPAMTLLRTFV